MINANQLAEAFGRNVQIIKRQCDGLTHQESLTQMPFRSNCMNWVLGHIADNRDSVLKLLGSEPILGDEGTRYRRNSEPITGEGEGVLPLESLLTLLENGQVQITIILQNSSPDDLNREIELFGRQQSVGAWLFFLYFHESYHTGQTELMRQVTDKNDKII